jgi:hypothetical protein
MLALIADNYCEITCWRLCSCHAPPFGQLVDSTYINTCSFAAHMGIHREIVFAANVSSYATNADGAKSSTCTLLSVRMQISPAAPSTSPPPPRSHLENSPSILRLGKKKGKVFPRRGSCCSRDGTINFGASPSREATPWDGKMKSRDRASSLTQAYKWRGEKAPKRAQE